MLHLSEFVWTLRTSVLVVFNNFLLIDATDRSKISSDQKSFFIALGLCPHSFFANTPFNRLCIAVFFFQLYHPYFYFCFLIFIIISKSRIKFSEFYNNNIYFPTSKFYFQFLTLIYNFQVSNNPRYKYTGSPTNDETSWNLMSFFFTYITTLKLVICVIFLTKCQFPSNNFRKKITFYLQI